MFKCGESNHMYLNCSVSSRLNRLKLYEYTVSWKMIFTFKWIKNDESMKENFLENNNFCLVQNKGKRRYGLQYIFWLLSIGPFLLVVRGAPELLSSCQWWKSVVRLYLYLWCVFSLVKATTVPGNYMYNVRREFTLDRKSSATDFQPGYGSFIAAEWVAQWDHKFENQERYFSEVFLLLK